MVVDQSLPQKALNLCPEEELAPPANEEFSAESSRESSGKTWELRLYVAGQTPKSLAAFANLKRICEEHLLGQYRIEVIDLLENPHLAREDQILAIPTLVRKLPQPLRKIIGDLSHQERVLMGGWTCAPSDKGRGRQAVQ